MELELYGILVGGFYTMMCYYRQAILDTLLYLFPFKEKSEYGTTFDPTMTMGATPSRDSQEHIWRRWTGTWDDKPNSDLVDKKAIQKLDDQMWSRWEEQKGKDKEE